MTFSLRTRTSAFVALLLFCFAASPSIAAAGSDDRAERPTHVHRGHHAHRASHLGRAHIQTSPVQSQAAQPSLFDLGNHDPDAARYGYVSINCPRHLDSPHEGTPDGFFYAAAGQKRFCY